MKIVKDHQRIQIYEFLVPQLLGLGDSEKIWKNLISGPKLQFFWIFGVLRQNSEIFQKSVKIFKNHTKIQIHGFLVPQLLVLRDSEKIWKNLICGPKVHCFWTLGVLRQNSEIFQKQ